MERLWYTCKLGILFLSRCCTERELFVYQWPCGKTRFCKVLIVRYRFATVLLLLLLLLTGYQLHYFKCTSGPTDGATRHRTMRHPTVPTFNIIPNILTSNIKTSVNHVEISKHDDVLSDDITIVTAYMNIGEFQKGVGNQYFTPELYHRWMGIFQRIQNPVIAYLDRSEDVDYFQKLREDLSKSLTKTVKVSRDHLWAFGLRSRIATIYAQPNYPKHPPNTVVPEYSCTMHAKYEFMQNATKSNPFKTRYFAWLDIGLFRDIVRKTESINLHLPAGFDSTKVAYTEVYSRDMQLSENLIFHENLVWVCGCYFIAEKSVMHHWTMEYMQATELFLSHNLMNTDQQVLYAMFVNQNTSDPIQPYRGTGEYNEWFHLGYVCRE